MPFVPHSFEPYNADDEPAITVDGKYGRLYINAAMREKLGVLPGTPFKCHVAYDTDTGNIGIALPGQVNVDDEVSPATFDRQRYFASARSFLKKWEVEPGKYVYIERKHGWFVFRRADLLDP